MTNNQKRDQALYSGTGDYESVKKHNDYIINKSIKKYEAMRRKKIDQAVDEYGERADAVVTYLKSLNNGGSSSNMERYFGKRMLAQLRGDEIRKKLMNGMTIMNKFGEVIKPANSDLIIHAKK